MFRKKDLVISFALLALMSWAEIDAGEEFFPYVMGLCFLVAVICTMIWSVQYDRFDKDADIFGIGLRNRFPRIVKGQEKMNIFALNAYLWLAIPIVSILVLELSWKL